MTQIVKGIIVSMDEFDTDVFLEDGGYAEIHRADGGYYITVYQSRIPPDFKDMESAYEELGNGKAYTICDSEVVGSKPALDDLYDALHWLVVGDYEFELLFIHGDNFNDDRLRKMLNDYEKTNN